MRPNTVKRTLWLGLGAVAAVAITATGASGGSDRALVPSTLKPFTSLTLSGSKGAIRAVVYDGNHAVASLATTAITGFTVPPAPFTAKTTYVIADGQCSSASPNGCRGVSSAVGIGDKISFAGGAGTASLGPDAIKGSDGCPWGEDTCLWDTLSFDVSHYAAPGDTTASVTLEVGPSPTDCFNHEAQVFAVGPSSAWTDAGYVAAGIGLRNQGSGNVTVGGIPAGAVVQKAFLYWNILNETDPLGAIAVNQTRFAGTMIGRDESPCWPTPWSWAYRADVTSRVKGNGVYTISGYPTGSTTGRDPWVGDPARAAPMMEGASLIVFYGKKAPPNTVPGSPSGAVLVNGKSFAGGPIPFGAKVDVTKGAVTLSPIDGTLTASGGADITAQFVLVRAKAAGKPIVELQLTGGDFNACAKRVVQASGKTAKTVRRLWAKGNGKFRTRGQYASALIRGTDWLTADRCDGTLVQVREGVVTAFDLVLKKTVVVNAGQSYVAKKKPSARAAAARVGQYAGPMVFRFPNGSIQQTQYARLSVTNVTRTKRRASVRWTYSPVGWTAPATCTHNLEETSAKGQAVTFRVSSMTGSCIPNAKGYGISLNQDRAVAHLVYENGLTAAGSLPKR